MRTVRSEFPALAVLLVLFTASTLFSQTKQGAVERIKIHAKSLEIYLPAVLAEAAAWSPNPANPPLYFDLPTGDEQYQADVGARWAANAPLAIDVGEQVGLSRDAKIFDGILTGFNVPHIFETYQGDHTNHRTAQAITL